MKPKVPTEYEEQVALVSWLDSKGLKYSSIPNSTFTTSWNQKRKNHMTGLRAGLPDLLIITPKGLLFVEMKRTKGGVVSLEQKSWIEELNKCNGVQAEVCLGCEAAITFVSRFL